MRSRNSTTQNELFDSKQTHSALLALPDGCKHLGEDRIIIDMESERERIDSQPGNLACFFVIFLYVFYEIFFDIYEVFNIPSQYHLIVFGMFVGFSVLIFMISRRTHDHLVFDKSDKSIYFCTKATDISNKRKTVYLSFDEIEFIAIDCSEEAVEDFGPTMYKVKAITNSNKLLCLTDWTANLYKIELFAKYLAEVTNSTFLIFPNDGTQLRMVGNQPVYKKLFSYYFYQKPFFTFFFYLILVSLVFYIAHSLSKI